MRGNDVPYALITSHDTVDHGYEVWQEGASAASVNTGKMALRTNCKLGQVVASNPGRDSWGEELPSK